MEPTPASAADHDLAERGKYLATIGSCTDCHTQAGQDGETLAIAAE